MSTAATPYDKRAKNVAARPSDGRGFFAFQAAPARVGLTAAG